MSEPHVFLVIQKLLPADREHLIQTARDAALRGYAPYSKYKVGAALLTASREVFSGCNVENTSYGLTNCAERTAIFTAIAQSGPALIIDAIAVVNDQGTVCSPCGACRQVIYEFGPEAVVIFLSATGWREIPITELLPEGFRFR